MSKIAEKLDAMRGGGHHVPVGLDEILTDIDERLTALEGGKKEVKAFSGVKQGSPRGPMETTLDHGLKPYTPSNPLDGERSDG